MQAKTLHDLCLTKVITLITTTKLHFRDIVKQCEDNDSDLKKILNVKIAEIKLEAYLLDESVKSILASMKKYCESIIKEIEVRFND